jgi:hypothetical protein
MVIPRLLAVQGLAAEKLLRRQSTSIPAPRAPFMPQQNAAAR